MHAKCISCDRPLNINRDKRLGELPVTVEAFGADWTGPKGPGWEAGPRRALWNGDQERYEELKCGFQPSPHDLVCAIIASCWQQHGRG